MSVAYLDARRLTGPNVLSDQCGSILDIACTAEETDAVIRYCESETRRMLVAVGWANESVYSSPRIDGVSIAFSAPIDALYAASAISEWVWECCDANFNDGVAPELSHKLKEITRAIADEVNPPLLNLQRAAKDHGISFLWDDDDVSVGHGDGGTTWPFRDLPRPNDLDWSHFHDVPVGIVTGTNGKTTTVRIAKHILQKSGQTVGVSCTDWVSVNDKIIDRDDWSGPGGARMVLRQPNIDVAILETARGGLLRRGLGLEFAQVALITNIAEDHLGDFGSKSVAELLEIKWVVSHAVLENGHLILNADDALLVEKAVSFPGRIVWFSLDDRNPVVSAHTAKGGSAVVYSGGDIVRLVGGDLETICSASDIPITLNGAALHNIANALGAAAMTSLLGVSLDQIRQGLTTMSQDVNPGRSNVFEIEGFSVLVDFAHNPEAMQALFSMARTLPAKRRALCFGQAGDRTDEQIRELAISAWSIGLDLVVVSELESYRRGREPGEVYRIIRDQLVNCGADEKQVLHFQEEADSFNAALDWAKEGDLVVILDLGRVSAIGERLRGATEVRPCKNVASEDSSRQKANT